MFSYYGTKKKIAKFYPEPKYDTIIEPFAEIPDFVGTWYIDPPYQFGGQYYHSTSSNKLINYEELRNWSLSRKGEIIVCENSKANWMEFKPLVELKGQLHTTMEVIYYKENK